MKKVAIIFIVFALPLTIFASVNFGTRLLVYPSTFSVDMSVSTNNNVILKTKVYIIWWLKVGFLIAYPEAVSDIFVMADFSNDLSYATFISNDKVYFSSLGDSYSTLDFFKKYVIQIIRNYYIYGKSKEVIPFTNVGYYIKVNEKDSSLKEIDFVLSNQKIKFSFSNWNFDMSEVMNKVRSFLDKNKIKM